MLCFPQRREVQREGAHGLAPGNDTGVDAPTREKDGTYSIKYLMCRIVSLGGTFPF